MHADLQTLAACVLIDAPRLGGREALKSLISAQTRSKKLLVASGIITRNKKLLVTRNKGHRF